MNRRIFHTVLSIPSSVELYPEHLYVDLKFTWNFGTVWNSKRVTNVISPTNRNSLSDKIIDARYRTDMRTLTECHTVSRYARSPTIFHYANIPSVPKISSNPCQMAESRNFGEKQCAAIFLLHRTIAEILIESSTFPTSPCWLWKRFPLPISNWVIIRQRCPYE